MVCESSSFWLDVDVWWVYSLSSCSSDWSIGCADEPTPALGCKMIELVALGTPFLVCRTVFPLAQTVVPTAVPTFWDRFAFLVILLPFGCPWPVFPVVVLALGRPLSSLHSTHHSTLLQHFELGHRALRCMTYLVRFRRVRLAILRRRSRVFASRIPKTSRSRNISSGVMVLNSQPSAMPRSAVRYWSFVSPDSWARQLKRYLWNGTFLSD